jgi:hypothetical protein
MPILAMLCASRGSLPTLLRPSFAHVLKIAALQY